MRKEHLGTSSELCWFAMRMAEELEKHIDEKSSLREWECRDVQHLVVNEIKKRLEIIAKQSTEETNEQEQIEKQCIHIANYAMMLFLRSKYNV